MEQAVKAELLRLERPEPTPVIRAEDPPHVSMDATAVELRAEAGAAEELGPAFSFPGTCKLKIRVP